MLSAIDRVQLAVADQAEAATGWVALLGAVHDGEDRVDCLGARRTRYRVGDGWVEFLEPDGAGAVSDALAARGRNHLFAAGATAPDLPALVARLRERGVDVADEGGHAYLAAGATGGHGLRLVVSAETPSVSERVGMIATFYEVTNLVHDPPATVGGYADLFALDSSAFQPIGSPHYGYEGTLTLFHRERLDRFEVIMPNDSGKTMGRFFEKFDESLYMGFAEAPDLAALDELLTERGAPHTTERDRQGEPHTIFLHPPALGGMMLGLSRPTYAWTWSGHPEWVDRR